MADQFGYEKKDYSNIENDPYVQKFLEGVKSIRQRLALIQEYCEFNEMNPEELIIEKHEDSLKTPLEQTDISKTRLHSFFGYLTNDKDERWSNTINSKVREKKVSWNSARQYVYSKLASFYAKNNVDIKFGKKSIPYHKKQGTKDKTWRNGEKRINNDEYKTILKQIRDSLNNIRDKAVFLCKISSAMDDVDLFKLKIGDFRKGYYENDNVCYIAGERQKTNEFFQTFFNSEACDMISLYFKERERKIIESEEREINRPLTDKEKKNLELKETDWLFVGNKKVDGEFTQYKSRLFAKEIRETCKKLNINNITPKALRRWFETTLSKKIEATTIKRMMGHSVEINSDYRIDFSTSDAFEEIYVKEIEELTLLGNGNGKIIEVNKEIEKLKADNEALKNELVNVNKKFEELSEIVKLLAEKKKSEE